MSHPAVPNSHWRPSLVHAVPTLGTVLGHKELRGLASVPASLAEPSPNWEGPEVLLHDVIQDAPARTAIAASRLRLKRHRCPLMSVRYRGDRWRASRRREHGDARHSPAPVMPIGERRARTIEGTSVSRERGVPFARSSIHVPTCHPPSLAGAAARDLARVRCISTFPTYPIGRREAKLREIVRQTYRL